ncbi:7-carboxy-7-deazaguanine synthase QueE [Streptomyces sp. URMC 126]|uniref:7-carboxy-7-deazaguanine synthase QueE n=1 Tax=Streptomyces sp. URMC 126 TaxID=3423401 RepID=UPI003F1C67D1
MSGTRSAGVAGTLVCAETFGPTVQGEGPSLGRRAGFVRLGGCNLHCRWCDTPYTWDASRFDLHRELIRTPVTDIAARALAGDPALVVITGGEPLLHQRQSGWAQLLRLLTEAAVDIEVETNGTIAPRRMTVGAVTRFNVSPKLPHAGDPESARIRPAALAVFGGTKHAIFKFVCRTASDVRRVAACTAAWDVTPDRVWIMPEGRTPAELDRHLAELADPAIASGFNVTTRLHIHVWGDERGR